MTVQAKSRCAGILGLGAYVPPTIRTNADLEQSIDTTDEWIISRTGIRERRIADPDGATSELAFAAGATALLDAEIDALDLDLIMVATCTPDHPGSFPSTASIVQARLGAKNAAAFDLGAVCAGFSYALHVASNLIVSGANNRILVIGAEMLSRIVDWNDRNTAVLFGDGAGAAVVGLVPAGGYLGGILGADGNGGPLLAVPSGGSRSPSDASALCQNGSKIHQNGKEVYKFAVSVMGQAALQAVESVGLTANDIDCFIPHQANIRIIAKAAERMGLPMEKVFVNLDKYGNTSAASIPIALDEAYRSGRLKPNDLVVLVGFGAGLTWGANVIRWTKAVPH